VITGVQLAVAETAIVDEVTRKVTLINVLSDMEAPDFPLFLPLIVVLAQFRRETAADGDFEGKLTIALSGEALTTESVRAEFRERNGASLLLRIGGLVLTKPGLLQITVEGNLDSGPMSCDFVVGKSGPPSVRIEGA